jgi:hypothetical protein
MNTAVCVFVFIFYLRFLRSAFCTRLQKTLHPRKISCGPVVRITYTQINTYTV